MAHLRARAEADHAGRATTTDDHDLALQLKGSFEHAVIGVIGRLRPGEVASYGEIAQEAGFPGAARAVGNVLAGAEGLPWWRVVRADGRLVSPKQHEQARRLKAEGVRVVGGKVRIK